MRVNTPTPFFCFQRFALCPQYGHGLRLNFCPVSFTAAFLLRELGSGLNFDAEYDWSVGEISAILG